MACKFAIFEYINEDNVLDIGDTKQIIDNVDKNLLNNARWDFDLKCRVQSKGKGGRMVTSAAKIIRFDDDRKALTEILDGLLDGQKLADIIHNQESFKGRGRRQLKKTVVSSSDEENETTLKQMPAKKQKVKAKSDQELLARLKEKTTTLGQVKTAHNTRDDRTVFTLRKEVDELKEVVLQLKDANASLLSAIQRFEENNTSLVRTVASLSDLPSMVEKLTLLMNQQVPSARVGETQLCDTTKVQVHRRHVSPTPAPQPSPPHSSDPSLAVDDQQHSIQPHAQHVEISAQDSEIGTADDVPTDSNEFIIPVGLVNRANKTDARKMTNDLLHGLHSVDFLASHSVTGGGKPGMDEQEVKSVITAVVKQFTDKTDMDVRFYMREKLNNAAKVIRRRQKKMTTTTQTSSLTSVAIDSVPAPASLETDIED